MERAADIRVGTAERERAVAALSEHMAAERLTRDEFEARIDVAYRAVSQSDLRDLFADLPAPDWEGALSTGSPAAPEPAAPAYGMAGRAAALAGAVLPAAGVIGLVLAVLTGSWYWLVLLPPAVYGVRQLARKVQDGDQKGRTGRPELR
ncbi:DUF1707 SHOCT-like domain-containing protein [Streptomyces guryensis]|uniref:DUF1707 domain-containing protein n=1 Tax=Streptomyces guryensis TaxID=2886947 RepID=A0A9Q3Z481_9ACTN|nr:DUF1707 domain-containing protein [Streptomyces guryensis]MCD9872459.1 DUF1707 domain-containing protein [Streptomyces guryensis]